MTGVALSVLLVGCSGTAGSDAPTPSASPPSNKDLASRSGNLVGTLDTATSIPWTLGEHHETTLDAAGAAKAKKDYLGEPGRVSAECTTALDAAIGQVPVGSQQARNRYHPKSEGSDTNDTADFGVVQVSDAAGVVTILRDKPECVGAGVSTVGSSDVAGYPSALLTFPCGGSAGIPTTCVAMAVAVGDNLLTVSVGENAKTHMTNEVLAHVAERLITG